MRARLLAATVDCLVERGYAGTSTTLVSQRAGVSRGAQLHHFPTKNALVVAAVEHLTERRGASCAAAAPRCRPAPGAPGRCCRCWATTSPRPVFMAALELWVAARTDAALLAAVGPLEQRVGRETHRLTVELLGADESRPGVRSSSRPPSTSSAGSASPTPSPTTPAGAAASSTTGPTCSTRARTTPRQTHGPTCWPTCWPTWTPTDRLWAAVVGLDDAGWATPTPAAGWSVATQVAHLLWTDERGRRGGQRPQAWDAVVLAAGRPDGYVDRRAEEVAAWSPRPCSPAGAARAGLVEALRAVPAGTRMPWFGPPMSAASMATARFMETWAHSTTSTRPSGSTWSPPTGSATSPTWACAPAGSPSPPAAWRRRPPRSGSSSSPRRAGCGRSGRPTPPSGSAGPPSTSACSSPSAATAPTSASSPTGPGGHRLAAGRAGVRRDRPPRPRARAGPA